MKIDLDEKTELTKWQLIQIIVICLALASGATILNQILGFVFIGLALCVFATPILLRIWSKKE